MLCNLNQFLKDNIKNKKKNIWLVNWNQKLSTTKVLKKVKIQKKWRENKIKLPQKVKIIGTEILAASKSL